MASKIVCEVLASSDYIHLQQIYTGLALLHDAGKIEFRQKITPKKLGMFEEVHLKMRVGDRTVYFDMHDCGTIDENYLDDVDVCFKRSYAPDVIEKLSAPHKILTFGLNHYVLRGGFDRFLLARTSLYKGSQKVRAGIKAAAIPFQRSAFPPTVERLRAEPAPHAEPQVIFMTQVYDTSQTWQKDIEKVRGINEMRAEIVRHLRKEFGQRFFGGIAKTEFAEKHFADCIFDNSEVSKRSNYFRKLQNFPICVTSRGLCNSTGWKFAEYVAFAKAIVSERLTYEVDENFAENQNYIAFESVEECLEQTHKLFENHDLRAELMSRNRIYFENFQRADRLVWNCLQRALEI